MKTFCGTQVLIFALNTTTDVIALYLFGTRFHQLGSRSQRDSILYFLESIIFDQKHKFVVCEDGFSINSKASFMS